MWEILLRYLFLAAVIFMVILQRGAEIEDVPKKTKVTVALLLLFAFMDIYHGIWERFKSYVCDTKTTNTTAAPAS